MIKVSVYPIQPVQLIGSRHAPAQMQNDTCPLQLFVFNNFRKTNPYHYLPVGSEQSQWLLTGLGLLVTFVTFASTSWLPNSRFPTGINDYGITFYDPAWLQFWDQHPSVITDTRWRLGAILIRYTIRICNHRHVDNHLAMVYLWHLLHSQTLPWETDVLYPIRCALLLAVSHCTGYWTICIYFYSKRPCP